MSPDILTYPIHSNPTRLSYCLAEVLASNSILSLAFYHAGHRCLSCMSLMFARLAIDDSSIYAAWVLSGVLQHLHRDFKQYVAQDKNRYSTESCLLMNG